MMDDQDPGKGPVAGGQGLVGVDLGPFVAGERDVPGAEGLFGCGHSGLLLSSFRVASRRGACDRCAGPTMASRQDPLRRNRHDVRRAPTVRGPGRARLAGRASWRVNGVAGAGLRRRAVVRTLVGSRPARHPGRHRARCGRGPLHRRHRSLPRGRGAGPRPGPSTGSTFVPATPPRWPDGRCAGAGTIGHPSGVAVDRQGDVYIAEATAQRVQVVRPAGRAVVTVAGTGRAGFNGDGLAGPASAARPTDGGGGRRGGRPVHRRHGQLPGAGPTGPTSTLFGQAGDAGHLSTVAGTGVCGSAGQGGPLAAAQLWNPVAVTVDRARRPARGRQRRPVRAPGAGARRDLLRHRRSAPATSAWSWAGPGATGRISPTVRPRPAQTAELNDPRASPSARPARSSSPTASCTSSGWCPRPPARCSGAP